MEGRALEGLCDLLCFALPSTRSEGKAYLQAITHTVGRRRHSRKPEQMRWGSLKKRKPRPEAEQAKARQYSICEYGMDQVRVLLPSRLTKVRQSIDQFLGDSWLDSDLNRESQSTQSNAV